MKPVKKNIVYNYQTYLMLVLKKCFFITSNIKKPRNFIDKVLKENGMTKKSYRLDQMEYVLNDNVQVVLVDCSYYKGDQYIQQYRWYQI